VVGVFFGAGVQAWDFREFIEAPQTARIRVEPDN